MLVFRAGSLFDKTTQRCMVQERRMTERGGGRICMRLRWYMDSKEEHESDTGEQDKQGEYNEDKKQYVHAQR